MTSQLCDVTERPPSHCLLWLRPSCKGAGASKSTFILQNEAKEGLSDSCKRPKRRQQSIPDGNPSPDAHGWAEYNKAAEAVHIHSKLPNPGFLRDQSLNSSVHTSRSHSSNHTVEGRKAIMPSMNQRVLTLIF